MPEIIQIVDSDNENPEGTAADAISIANSDSEEGEVLAVDDFATATIDACKSNSTLDTDKEGSNLVINNFDELASPTTNIEDGEIPDETESNNNGNENIVQLEFFKKINYDKYGSLIINAIKRTLIESEQGKVINFCIHSDDNSHRIVFSCESEANGIFPENNENRRNRTVKEQSPDLSGLPELFMIDKEPVEKLDKVLIPSYMRAVEDVLLDEEAAAIKKKKIEIESLRVKSPNACFNCGDTDHNVRECPLPYSVQRVRSAKKALNNRPERYHADVEQRFSHLRPGCLSKNLRQALGLNKNELPFFFYRMRWLGYPPGWLEDAKVEHSGIALFNSHSDDGNFATCKTVQSEVCTPNHKYNIYKIIDFPGFNQYPGDKFYDDYRYHKVPPFDNRQLKEVFIKNLGECAINGYKRRKLKEMPSTDGNNDCTLCGTDMDIEDPNITDGGVADGIDYSQEKLSADDAVHSTDKQINAISMPALNNDNNDHCRSPSLTELQTRQDQLIKELQTENFHENNSKDPPTFDDDIEVINLNDTNSHSTMSKETSRHTESNVKTIYNSNDSQKEKSIVIKESYMGTPILKFTPYNSLPNGKNFKAGVSDVINFENLPDSTGKYENMKLVIKKVRNTIKEMHKDES